MDIILTNEEIEIIGMIIENKLNKTKWVLENRDTKDKKEKLENAVKAYDKFLNMINYKRKGKIFFSSHKR